MKLDTCTIESSPRISKSAFTHKASIGINTVSIHITGITLTFVYIYIWQQCYMSTHYIKLIGYILSHDILSSLRVKPVKHSQRKLFCV